MADLYVFRSQPSEGACRLADMLGGKKISRLDNATSLAQRGKMVICWGTPVAGPKVLNQTPLINKYQQALQLINNGVPTIEVTPRRPTPVPDVLMWPDRVITREMAPLVIEELREFMVQRNEEWLPRLNMHVGGDDLLNPPAQPDYWSKKLDIIDELRIHCFRGKSIRAGRKVARENVPSHAWIRSFDGGWKLSYDGFKSTKAQRELAARAVKALSLDFGAVDIAVLHDGSLRVLEVNRAPGLEGGTVDCYAKAIEQWREELECGAVSCGEDAQATV